MKNIKWVFMFPNNQFPSIYYGLTKSEKQFVSKIYLDSKQMSYIRILDEFQQNIVLTHFKHKTLT